MAASDTALLLGAAAIGAGGAVLAQVVTSVFTGRRQDREWEIRRDERFLDLKRELYSDYLAQAGQVMSYVNWNNEHISTPRPDEFPDTEGLRRIQENIGLVAAGSLFTKVQEASATVTGVMWDIAGGAKDEDIRDQKAEARETLDAVRRDMRADLRGEEDKDFQPAPRPQA